MNQVTQPSPTAIICIGYRFNDQPIIESSELFGASRSAIIRHQDEAYTLENPATGN